MLELSPWSSPGLASLLRSLTDCSDLSASIYDLDGSLVTRVFSNGELIGHLSGKLSEQFIPELESFERRVVLETLGSGENTKADFVNRLSTIVVPIRVMGTIQGAVALGYVFTRYPSPEDCNVIANAFGDTYLSVWHHARKDVPSTETKLEKFAILFQSVLESHVSGTISGLQLQAADVIKDELLSVVSHELKTPLTAGLLRLQMLKRKLHDEVGSEDWIRILDLATAALGRQERIINDLLDVAKISKGALQYDKLRMNANDLIQECASEMRDLIESRGLGFEVELPSETIDFEGDATRIKQVVLNLLNNALKFSDSGKIVLRLLGGRDSFRVEVKDMGIGLSREEIGRIFSKFVQASNSRSFKGLGLGLYLADQIVKAHNGRIFADSEGPGRGASFAFEIPRS